MDEQCNELVLGKHNGIQAILDAPCVKEKGVEALPNNMKDAAAGLMGLLKSGGNYYCNINEPFFVLDLAKVAGLMDRWVRAMPYIHPYYAIKCNPDIYLVSSMAALGANFDCASKSEIQLVLSLGVSPHRIVFANPCKLESHLLYAKSVGVTLVTYDSLFEIHKIQRLYPECALLLRLKVPEEGAETPLGSKYGALPEEMEPLLLAAKSAGLPVFGISFHVGSGSNHPQSYKDAIALARAAFELAAQLGMPKLKLLDIGGGFTSGPSFEAAAEAINSAIELHFPKCNANEPSFKVIAEPGRYFAESVMILAANIIGKRVRGDLREYWIAYGLYGSLSCINFDKSKANPKPLAATSDPGNPTCQGRKRYPSTVFGPTWDSVDTVATNYALPEMEVGDWLVFEEMGAYASSLGSSFNGFITSDIPTRLVYGGLAETTSFEKHGLDGKPTALILPFPEKKPIDVGCGSD